MKKLIFCVILLLGIILPVKAKDPLTKRDIKAIYAFNILQTIDMFQTFEIVESDEWYETNPILGKHPNHGEVLGYFILRGLAHYETTKLIPAKYRDIWHTYNIVYNLDAINQNHKLGIRISF